MGISDALPFMRRTIEGAREIHDRASPQAVSQGNPYYHHVPKYAYLQDCMNLTDAEWSCPVDRVSDALGSTDPVLVTATIIRRCMVTLHKKGTST